MQFDQETDVGKKRKKTVFPPLVWTLIYKLFAKESKSPLQQANPNVIPQVLFIYHRSVIRYR